MPDNQESIRDSLGRFKPGFSGNLKGRTPGKTLKEYVRDYLSKLSDEEKDEWLGGLPKDIVWRMAEGNPKEQSEVAHSGEIKTTTIPAEALAIIEEDLKKKKLNED